MRNTPNNNDKMTYLKFRLWEKWYYWQVSLSMAVNIAKNRGRARQFTAYTTDSKGHLQEHKYQQGIFENQQCYIWGEWREEGRPGEGG